MIHVGVPLQERLLVVHSTLVGVTTQDLVHQHAPVGLDKAEHVRSFHRSSLLALHELVQAAGLDHLQELNAHHIVRRLSDTEVRLLGNLGLQGAPGALPGPLDAQPSVFHQYWPLANPHSLKAKRANLEAPEESALAAWRGSPFARPAA